VYRALVDLVKSRIEKAKSLGKKKKTKEGIDVDAFVKTIRDNIGENTLGKFYREKVLTQKSLLIKTLPKISDEIKIEKGLFGWILSSGKQRIECHSKEEARYFKVFVESGLDKVKIPRDESYLSRIISELEELKKRIDEVTNSYLESIVDTKTREKLKKHLWSELIK